MVTFNYKLTFMAILKYFCINPNYFEKHTDVLPRDASEYAKNANDGPGPCLDYIFEQLHIYQMQKL